MAKDKDMIKSGLMRKHSRDGSKFYTHLKLVFRLHTCVRVIFKREENSAAMILKLFPYLAATSAQTADTLRTLSRQSQAGFL